MSEAEDGKRYRGLARLCREAAGATEWPHVRLQLIDLARRCEQLADDAEQDAKQRLDRD
jgi:hypothetical protein